MCEVREGTSIFLNIMVTYLMDSITGMGNVSCAAVHCVVHGGRCANEVESDLIKHHGKVHVLTVYYWGSL